MCSPNGGLKHEKTYKKKTYKKRRLEGKRSRTSLKKSFFNCPLERRSERNLRSVVHILCPQVFFRLICNSYNKNVGKIYDLGRLGIRETLVYQGFKLGK
jgi:hypothetical protein